MTNKRIEYLCNSLDSCFLPNMEKEEIKSILKEYQENMKNDFIDRINNMIKKLDNVLFGV